MPLNSSYTVGKQNTKNKVVGHVAGTVRLSLVNKASVTWAACHSGDTCTASKSVSQAICTRVKLFVMPAPLLMFHIFLHPSYDDVIYPSIFAKGAFVETTLLPARLQYNGRPGTRT